MSWPIVELDNVRRLRALHASLPGTTFAETVVAARFDEVWPVLGDVEGAFGGLVPDVREVRVLSRDGERLRATVMGRSGLRAPFDIVVRDGWCAMQSRFLLFAMTAVPDGHGTRFAYLAGLRLPGRRLWAPLAAPFGRLAARSVLRRIERRFAAPA